MTQVKEIPLRHLVQCLDGRRIPLNQAERADIPGEIPYWGSGGVVGTVGKHLFDEPLVLLGEDGAPFYDRDRDVAFKVSGKTWVNNHIHALRPVSGVDHQYLTYALNNVDYSLYISGSTRDKLTQQDMLRILVPMWPLKRQHAITRTLDLETAEIDDLIGKQERLIELLAEKRQAVITKAVTKGLDAYAPTKPSGIPWLGSIPAHWKASRLKFSLKRIEQGVSPQADAIPASSDSWGVLKSGCVNGGIFKEDENKQLPIDFAIDPCIVVAVGDLLVSRASGSPKLVGSAARVRSLESKLILSDKTFRFVPGQEIDADFLECVLNSQPYRKQVEGSISGAEGLANNISTTALKNIAFALPPRSEQLTISEELRHRVDALLSLESKSTRAVQLLRERRSALISAAVTGRLDYDLD